MGRCLDGMRKNAKGGQGAIVGQWSGQGWWILLKEELSALDG